VALRCQYEVLPGDRQFLDQYGLPWEAISDGSPWILMHEFPTPAGYNHRNVTAAIRLETGYPAAQLDMVYFYPPLARLDGKPIGATEVKQMLDGKEFQRWSRHRTTQNPWKPGEDDLGSHVTLIEDWLAREFEK
jgi:hypothetical protein